jgi:hypothetical protein
VADVLAAPVDAHALPRGAAAVDLEAHERVLRAGLGDRLERVLADEPALALVAGALVELDGEGEARAQRVDLLG